MLGGVSMSNIDPNISGDQNDVRNEIEGLWSVNDLIKEFYSLSDKFVDYKRGLVKLPSVKHRQILLQQNKECTFIPKINDKSKKIEQKTWQIRLASEQDS